MESCRWIHSLLLILLQLSRLQLRIYHYTMTATTTICYSTTILLLVLLLLLLLLTVCTLGGNCSSKLLRWTGPHGVDGAHTEHIGHSLVQPGDSCRPVPGTDCDRWLPWHAQCLSLLNDVLRQLHKHQPDLITGGIEGRVQRSWTPCPGGLTNKLRTDLVSCGIALHWYSLESDRNLWPQLVTTCFYPKGSTQKSPVIPGGPRLPPNTMCR